MSNTKIQANDHYHFMRDELRPRNNALRGVVTISERDKRTGSINQIEKKNLIVYQGREWLLQRAFSSELLGYNDNRHKFLKWFGVGTGGGEIGNPLQAGSTRPWDLELVRQIRLNPEDNPSIIYGRKFNELTNVSETGWYKRFSSVIRREDHANPYILDFIEYYPELVADITIELADIDCNGPSGTTFYDINEAALYLGNDNDLIGTEIQDGFSQQFQVLKIIVSGNDVKYILRPGSDVSFFTAGDRMIATNMIHPFNNVSIRRVIKEVGLEDGQCNAYVVIENPNGIDEEDSTGIVHLQKRGVLPEAAIFSRVTFSTIRKTIDREILFNWKIYF